MVAIGQVAPVVGELEANLDRTRELTAHAVAEGARLVVLPELNLSGYFTPPQLALAATDQRLRAATVGAGDAAVLLGFPELDNGVITGDVALWDPAGREDGLVTSFGLGFGRSQGSGSRVR